MPAVTNYRRNFIRGGSFFFTANLAERRLRLLVDVVELVMPGTSPAMTMKLMHSISSRRQLRAGPVGLNRPTPLI